MNYRKSVLSMSIIAALGFAGTAVAQDTAQHNDAVALHKAKADKAKAEKPAFPHLFDNLLALNDSAQPADTGSDTGSDQNPQPLGTIEVTGLRESLAASLATKRYSNAIVDAVTATDIGKFPATNVAEALAQIPGVTLDHSMPATQRVSIDGLDPSLNIALLDGHPVAQAMWLFGDSPNRGFNFSLLPPEIIGKVEIYKSAEAKLPAGGLGGTIIMHTVQPLDVKPGTISGSVGYNYNAMMSDGKPDLSVFYATRNSDGTFGIDISAQHYEQPINRQGMENYGYTDVGTIAKQNPAIAAEIASGKLNASDLMPNQLSAANFRQTEKRDSVLVNLQYKPNDAFESAVSLMWMQDNLANVNQSTYAWATLRPAGITTLGPAVNGIVTSGSSVDPNPPCANDTAGACGQKAITLSDNFARGSQITTKGIDWRTHYTANSWGVSTQVGISDSTNPITQVLKEIAYGGSFDWNLDKGFEFRDPATANNPAYWADYGWGGNHSQEPYAARDNYAQVDFSKDLMGSFFNEILFGLRYAGHWESQSLFVYGGFQPQTLTQIGYGGLTDLSGMSDLGLSDSMVSHVQTGGFGAIMGANPLSSSTTYPNNPDANSYWNNTWKVRQINDAGYVQANFTNGDNLRGNIGVRVVRTGMDSWGYVVPAACAAADSFSCTFPAGFGWTKASNTHTNVLPSFNIAYTVMPDVVLRGAASETIAWAPYNQLAPYFQANDTVLTATAGNPNLSPYKSANFSISAEWYFNQASVLAASLFYKDVSNYIVNKAQFEQHINGSWTLPGYLNSTGNAQIAAGFCTAAGVCKYSVTQPVDGGSAKVKGLALSYQQAFANGFGLRANYTYSDATTSSGGAMPYNSKNAYSIGPYFERGPVTASLAYNWRSKYLAGGYVAGAPATTIDAWRGLNGSVSYAFNSNLSLEFDAINLLNSTYKGYLGSNSTQFTYEYKTGQEYLLSLHFKF